MEPIATEALAALYATLFSGEIGFFDVILEMDVL
jgi:hypothetical protein